MKTGKNVENRTEPWAVYQSYLSVGILCIPTDRCKALMVDFYNSCYRLNSGKKIRGKITKKG